MVNKETFCRLGFLQDKKHDCLAKIAQIYSSLLLTGGNHTDESFMLPHLYWRMEICLVLFCSVSRCNTPKAEVDCCILKYLLLVF